MRSLYFIENKWNGGFANFNEEYDLIYSVCYYLSRNKTKNIVGHLKQISKLRKQGLKVLPVIVCSVDNLDDYEQDLTKLFRDCHIPNDLQMLFMYNWGGTIAALWTLWKEFVGNFSNDVHVAHFEEDFYSNEIDWFDAAKVKLTPDIIYVGEFTLTGSTSVIAEYKTTASRGNARKKMRECEYWTDGGFYFTTKMRLCRIEEAIGVFHKGNQTVKYEHQIDGIDYGEVGFPTELWHAGFRFTSLYRNDFFIHH
jgi:hypothetical protein